MAPDDQRRAKNRARQKKYRERHAEELAAKNREQCKGYYAAHRAEIQERTGRYGRDNAKKIQAAKTRRYKEHPEVMLLKSAKQRARRDGVLCTITLEDVRRCIPEDLRCPITGQVFGRGQGSGGHLPNSMSLDRILPSAGYVPGNVAVISNQANSLKSDCICPEVFDRLADYLEGGLDTTWGLAGVAPTVSDTLVEHTQRDVRYRARHPERVLLKSARQRAKANALAFDLTTNDIREATPSNGACPITREPFAFSTSRASRQSMSLDRMSPNLGYTKGNVRVISHWANVLKGACTDPRIFRGIAQYLRTHEVGSTCNL